MFLETMVPICSTLNDPPSLEDYVAFHSMCCGPGAARRCIDSFEQGAVLVALQDDSVTAGTPTNAEEKNEHIHFFRLNEKPPFSLTMLSYYVSVIFSFTGLCSLLQRTRLVKAVEYTKNGEHESSAEENLIWRFKTGDAKWIESSSPLSETKIEPLRLPPEAMEYIIDRSFALGPLHEKTASVEKHENDDADSEATDEENSIPQITLIRRFEYEFGGFLSVMMLHFACTNKRTHLVEIIRTNNESTAGSVVNRLLGCIKSKYGHSRHTLSLPD